MNKITTLWDIRPGQSATVRALLSSGAMRRRLMDIGLVEGTKVQCVQSSPLGDPKAFLIRGAVIALRGVDARNILMAE